jgi:PIN domain nuclease of toxin-antitoxin system
MSRVVLDASALIAMLRDEPGADKVSAIVSSARMNAVNYAEVVSHFVHSGMPERDVDAMLDPLPIDWVPMDKELARRAGRLRAATAEWGLSLGDRSCLGLAERDGLPAWTADRAWRAVADAIGVEIIVIR